MLFSAMAKGGLTGGSAGGLFTNKPPSSDLTNVDQPVKVADNQASSSLFGAADQKVAAGLNKDKKPIINVEMPKKQEGSTSLFD